MDHFLRVYADQNERAIPSISRAAIDELMAYAGLAMRTEPHERTLILDQSDHIQRFEMPERQQAMATETTRLSPAASGSFTHHSRRSSGN